MATELRYGLVEGSGKGREIPIATTQYFHRQGGKFVYMNLGNASLCSSANLPAGWLFMPKQDAGKDGWKSVSGDTAMVVYGDPDNVFEVPVKEYAASLAASQIGLCFKIVHVGATYAMKQYAKVANTTASPLLVVDVDTTNKTARVKIHPKYRQR